MIIIYSHKVVIFFLILKRIKNHFDVTKYFIMNAVSYPRQLVYIGVLFKNACYNGAMQNKIEAARDL